MVSNFGYDETVTTSVNGWRRIGRACRVAAAGCAGLALVGVLSAGAVFGARHLGPGAVSHHAAQVAASHNSAPAPAAVAPPAAIAAANRPAAPAATVYLVGSQQQTDAAQADLDNAEAIGTQLGGTRSSARIAVVTTTADEAAWRSELADENALRAEPGLAEIELVDLR